MRFSEGEQIMADPVVRYEAHEKVSVITLNRPEKPNAISAELQAQLLAAFTRADEDAETSVVLLQAEGRSFCAGYDISAEEPGTDDWRSNPTKAHQHLSVQLDFKMTPWTRKRPVIASVQGHVMGGGCELIVEGDRGFEPAPSQRRLLRIAIEADQRKQRRSRLTGRKTRRFRRCRSRSISA
jgi:enoyl-CoA hydratase/carnithine racemase